MAPRREGDRRRVSCRPPPCCGRSPARHAGRPQVGVGQPRLGVKPPTVQRWDRGKAPPTPSPKRGSFAIVERTGAAGRARPRLGDPVTAVSVRSRCWPASRLEADRWLGGGGQTVSVGPGADPSARFDSPASSVGPTRAVPPSDRWSPGVASSTLHRAGRLRKSHFRGRAHHRAGRASSTGGARLAGLAAPHRWCASSYPLSPGHRRPPPRPASGSTYLSSTAAASAARRARRTASVCRARMRHARRHAAALVPGTHGRGDQPATLGIPGETTSPVPPLSLGADRGIQRRRAPLRRERARSDVRVSSATTSTPNRIAPHLPPARWPPLGHRTGRRRTTQRARGRPDRRSTGRSFPVAADGDGATAMPRHRRSGPRWTGATICSTTSERALFRRWG